MRLKEETTPESGSLSFEEIFLKYKTLMLHIFGILIPYQPQIEITLL